MDTEYVNNETLMVQCKKQSPKLTVKKKCQFWRQWETVYSTENISNTSLKQFLPVKK